MNGDEILTTREVHIAYLNSAGAVLFKQRHVVWSLERFMERLNKEAADNRKKGEGFTAWSCA